MFQNRRGRLDCLPVRAPEGSSIDGGHVSRIVLLRGAGSPGACMSSGDLCEIVGWR